VSEKPVPGWYKDPKTPGTKRYWTGEAWSDHRYAARPKPQRLPWGHRPEGIIWGSLLLAVGLGFFAGLAFLVSEQAGIITSIIVASFCNILLAVGVIAKGVELGIRAARHRPDLDF
jgi:hypothetical protein